MSIIMKAYIKEGIEEFGEDVTNVVTSPGAIWLFTMGKARLLKEDRLDKFCSISAKLLWIIQRRRTDCSTAIFSCAQG